MATNGQKPNGQWDTKTKYLKKQKSRSRILREKREYMRRKRTKIKVLKHGFSSREITMGRAVAKLRLEMAKDKPIDARIWNYAYAAFAEANEILKQHDRMLRLERKKIKARLFLAQSCKAKAELPIKEKSIITACGKCGRILFDGEKCAKCK